MTHDEMIAVIQADKEGKPIQMRRNDTGINWVDIRAPIWDFVTWDYRIKPDKKKQTVYLYAYKDGHSFVTMGKWDNSAQFTLLGEHTFEYEDEK